MADNEVGVFDGPGNHHALFEAQRGPGLTFHDGFIGHPQTFVFAALHTRLLQGPVYLWSGAVQHHGAQAKAMQERQRRSQRFQLTFEDAAPDLDHREAGRIDFGKFLQVLARFPAGTELGKQFKHNPADLRHDISPACDICP